MSNKKPNDLLARAVFTIVLVAVVALISFFLLTPYLTGSVRASILLDKTMMLTEESYEQSYNLTLRKGDKLYVQVTGFGQPIDIAIIRESPHSIIIDRMDLSFFEDQWTVPTDGTYLFRVSASVGNVKARITISKA